MDITTVDEIIQNAMKEGLFPGAALGLLLPAGKELYRLYGQHTFVPWSPQVDKDSIFDLASLTKPLCTALACAALMEEGRLSLEEPISSFFPDCPRDKKNITIAHLLTHSSGLGAWLPLYKTLMAEGQGLDHNKRHEFACKIILEKPLQYQTGQKSLYSDLGFILLGRIVKLVSGSSLFDFARSAIFAPLGLSLIVDSGMGNRELAKFVPTGLCPARQRLTWGLVNDLNAWAIGSVPGHAGLFSGIVDVVKLIKAVFAAYLMDNQQLPLSSQTVSMFLQYRSANPNISWALGFDRPSPRGSTAGEFFSTDTIGHLGYTGTSFWLDLRRKIGVIFLSARTFPFDTPESRAMMKSFRTNLHNSLMKELLQEG